MAWGCKRTLSWRLRVARPAWAHSCGCKPRRKLITANEVKRNCVRVTVRGAEAWIVICEPMDKNRIEGAAEQGECARKHEALVIKAKWRKSGGCAEKECVLTWGDVASWLKGRRGDTERGVISGHSRCLYGAKGQRNRRAGPSILGMGGTQMFALAKLVRKPGRVKPTSVLAARNHSGRIENKQARVVRRALRDALTSTIPTARCGPACRVGWEGSVR